jgi:integrase
VITLEVLWTLRKLALRINTRKAYASLMRTYFKTAETQNIFHQGKPTEVELCLIMVAYLRSHKITTLTNFVSAIKKHFELEGHLPRNILYVSVKRGLHQIFDVIDQTVHKNPVRRPALLRFIAYFISEDQIHFAFACSLNYWGALRISELLALRWRDLQFFTDCSAVIVRVAKNHSNPKASHVEHSVAVDCIPILAAKFKSSKYFKGDNYKCFSFSRRTYNRAIKRVSALFRHPKATSHSFRAGFITDAAAAGISDPAIALHTRHRSIRSLVDYKGPAMADLRRTTRTMLTEC